MVSMTQTPIEHFMPSLLPTSLNVSWTLSAQIALVSKISNEIPCLYRGVHKIDTERINELFAVSLPELTIAWLNNS